MVTELLYSGRRGGAASRMRFLKKEQLLPRLLTPMAGSDDRLCQLKAFDDTNAGRAVEGLVDARRRRPAHLPPPARPPRRPCPCNPCRGPRCRCGYYSRDPARRVRYRSNFDLFQTPAASWRDTLLLEMPAREEDILPAAGVQGRRHGVHEAGAVAWAPTSWSCCPRPWTSMRGTWSTTPSTWTGTAWRQGGGLPLQDDRAPPPRPGRTGPPSLRCRRYSSVTAAEFLGYYNSTRTRPQGHRRRSALARFRLLSSDPHPR
ncbi:LOW QUALITY PROTEIN: uncharacterized protein LOC105913948 [Setaria italica]|uniref:LOW QUALITY PROTEIN: uncharacterized protein LOC105913948 n=1 Tax=Setaria italica TaxID=4555 RepID=UPI000BE5A6EC|nr:LOW QUALITY PROTEIN: uncharacterized protein LOC105913948 [Setaria italica]